jgi:hypothetical protein
VLIHRQGHEARRPPGRPPERVAGVVVRSRCSCGSAEPAVAVVVVVVSVLAVVVAVLAVLVAVGVVVRVHAAEGT